MFSYDTLTEALDGLRARGYTIDFNLDYDRIHCRNLGLVLKPAEFAITEVYRFEGETDPADEAILYAIESRHGQKGVLVNGFGISADSVSNEMIGKLSLPH